MTSAPGSAPSGAGTFSQPLGPGSEPQLLLGRYRVIELRDQGGFGSVLVCWDVRLQRRVAVKCLPLDGDLGASAAMEEALAEARASSFLSHPNIVTLHDFEADDRYAYLVMEYVDGLTLAELLARVEGGVLIFDEVATVLASVASALAFAHQNGVLHLDIKPANVMVDRSGTVKLGDFGMATLASAAGWGGARGGTVGYMPPEQLSGDLVDERTDVFSLAAVCYEALTGTAPFLAATPQASLKLIQKGAPPLSGPEPELAGPVELAFMSALDPSPGGRMASPEEFAREVLPSLGDPEAGRASLAQLLDADPAGQEDFDEAPWRALDPPGRRLPWVAGACCRAANALVAAVLLCRLGPALGLHSWAAQGALALAGTVAGAAWPAAGAALGLAAVAVSLLMGGLSPVTVLAAVACGGLSVLWLLRCAGRSPLSAAALLAGPALGTGAFSPGLAGYALAPLAAAATGALGSFLGSCIQATGLVQGPGAPHEADIAQGFLNLLGNPGTWALAAFAALAAATCSGITGRGTRPAAVIGQVAAFILLECGLALQTGLENGRIWGLPPLPAQGLAVGSTILMLMLVTLFGPPESRWEEE